MRLFYERKSREVEAKLRTVIRDTRPPFGQSRRQDMQEILEDIKSFKSLLPNSVKTIALPDSDNSTEHASPPTLIK